VRPTVRIKHTFRLPPVLSSQLAEYAGRKRISQALVVEAALASFLSPDASERMEAAISRRLDRHAVSVRPSPCSGIDDFCRIC